MVIAIISILMTAGIVSLGGVGGKGVTSGVATAESVFNEARSTAIGRNLRACVLVAKELNPAYTSENLRRMVVAYEETDSTTGQAKNPGISTPNWVLSSRAVLLPEQTFYSERYSRQNQQLGKASLPMTTISGSSILNVKDAYNGTYYIYIFNSQGICTTPGAGFVIGSGVRDGSKSLATAAPRVMASGKHDFSGFVIWRNGNTSVYHSPAQISDSDPIANLNSGNTF